MDPKVDEKIDAIATICAGEFLFDPSSIKTFLKEVHNTGAFADKLNQMILKDKGTIHALTEEEQASISQDTLVYAMCYPLIVFRKLIMDGVVDPETTLRNMKGMVSGLCENVMYLGYAGFDVMNLPAVTRGMKFTMGVIEENW